MRGQKGITLVALIITIVVLLILAVVSITAIQNTGMIDKANQAGTMWNQGSYNEGVIRDQLEGTLNTYFNQYGNN